MSVKPDAFSTDLHGWAELAPKHQPAPSCRQIIRSKWVVVGAGFTGLSCARRLAELHPDDTIILLDARALAQGASGRNSGYAVSVSHFSGQYDAQLKHNFERINRINAAGLASLRNLVSAHQINCQWQEEGFYHAAADELACAEHKNFIDYLTRLELPHIPLDQDQLKTTLGTSWYQKGVHVPDGALLQPAMLVYGLAQHLPANVQVFENTPALDISSNSPFELTLPEATITADNVILATNYEAPKLGQLKRNILGSTLSGSFTRVLTDDERDSLGSKSSWGVLALHGGGATVRLTKDGRICLRNTAEYHGGKLLSDAELMQHLNTHRQAFDKRFPQLSQVAFEYSWSGVEGISGNGTNFFQNPTDGLYVAGGYNGSGLSRGTAFGLAIADYASGGESPLITDCLNSPKAQWLPPRPLLDIGAWFHVRKRFRGIGRDR